MHPGPTESAAGGPERSRSIPSPTAEPGSTEATPWDTGGGPRATGPLRRPASPVRPGGALRVIRENQGVTTSHVLEVKAAVSAPLIAGSAPLGRARYPRVAVPDRFEYSKLKKPACFV